MQTDNDTPKTRGLRFHNMNPEARAALSAAVVVCATAIAKVLPLLTMSFRECPTCGLKVANNYSERQAHEVLSGLLQKLQKL